jgi:hypothetical protein
MAYLSMGYIYGRKFHAEETELIRELRQVNRMITIIVTTRQTN